MPTDLDQQVPRFAEALDRAASAISVDEILRRGAVAVDVDRVEWPTLDQVPRIDGVAGIHAEPGHDENGERGSAMELVPAVAARPPTRRRVAQVVLGVAAAVVLVVGLAAIVWTGDEIDPVDVPASTALTPPTTIAVSPFVGVWLSTDTDGSSQMMEIARAGTDGYGVVIRDEAATAACAGGASTLTGAGLLATDTSLVIAEPELTCDDATTPAIGPPPQTELADFTLELDTATGELVDDFGVVWRRATERLEEFLAARIAGTGAEGMVEVLHDPDIDVPLLYATSSGAPYERYEIERVDARWPSGIGTFRVRLFADGDASVVEQEFFWSGGGFGMDDDATIENGQPLVLSYTSSDGEVSVSAPSTWQTWMPGKVDDNGGSPGYAPDVWFGGLWRPEEFFGSGERIELVDPVAYDEWCAEFGGSPLLSGPADAAAVAQQVVADPNFETTAPVAARVGGVEAVSIDVTLAPGGEACGVGIIDISRWIHGLREPGSRLRLYLVDLPEGMSVETLAITVVAPEERFDEVIEETKPIIDSIEFHPG